MMAKRKTGHLEMGRFGLFRVLVCFGGWGCSGFRILEGQGSGGGRRATKTKVSQRVKPHLFKNYRDQIVRPQPRRLTPQWFLHPDRLGFERCVRRIHIQPSPPTVNFLTMVLATNLLRNVPRRSSLTPPSGFLNSVRRPNPMASDASTGISLRHQRRNSGDVVQN